MAITIFIWFPILNVLLGSEPTLLAAGKVIYAATVTYAFKARARFDLPNKLLKSKASFTGIQKSGK